jgi:hypothetical protein
MKKITHKELASLLASKPGAMPIGIDAETDAKAKKTGNPYGSIRKRVRAVGFVGANYVTGLVREGARQGVDATSFEGDALPWGEWLTVGKVIVHKGQFYLRTQTSPGQRDRQPAKVLAYLGENGETLTKEQVDPFLPRETASAKQSAVGIAGDKQVKVRTYAFASLRKVRVAGQSFVVDHSSS